MKRPKPVLLLILDGWGASEDSHGNAIKQANTPTWDRLIKNYPYSEIEGCGKYVGLPHGQIGNSEVGHLTMGAGRVIHQDLAKINHALEDGSFFKNQTLVGALEAAEKENHAIHLMGLLSPGGVHSHEDHIFAVLTLSKEYDCPVYVHAFLDGRDTSPKSALDSLSRLENKLLETPNARLATLMGRYYAMDRDKRWDRVQSAFDAIVHHQAPAEFDNAKLAIESYYEQEITDEFIPPSLIDKQYPGIRANDAVLFMNFRADRARQLCHALTNQDFAEFDRSDYVPIRHLITLTNYDDTLPAKIIYEKESLVNVFGEHLQNLGLKQLRLAETEKYAHVTFFFNGGTETPFAGEHRHLISSPKVKTYDLKPEMSAQEVCDYLVEAIHSGDYDAIICNFANADMVGHTGNFEATIEAIECLDNCLSKILNALKEKNGAALITADHGNADCMFAPGTNDPHTAHTLAKVPFVYYGNQNFEIAEQSGSLQDIAPSLLYVMSLDKPPEMTGQSLLRQKKS